MEQLTLDHTQELYDLTEANREHLREWLPWLDFIKSSHDTKKFIESTIAESSTGGARNYAIKYEGVICGVAGFHEINKQHKIGSIGYWLAQPFEGKGIISHAITEILEIGYGEFNLNKIEIHCAVGNEKSRAIPERLGFTYEATLRQSEWLYSKYVDQAIYSMLAAEYNALKAC
ncbi:GNAT family protein [Aurantivibrio infirmus]